MARKHTVKSGDCMASIARLYGFVNPSVIWESDGHKDLREKRKNPDVLAPGDVVAIPDKKVGKLTIKAGASAKLTLKHTPIKLRLKVVDDHGMKCKAERYVLHVDGIKDPFEGKLKETGEIDIDIPVVARRATLDVFAKGVEAPIQHFELQLGQMDPVETVAGVQARLEALGYSCGGVDGKLGPLTRAAIRAFERTHGLKPTGDPKSEALQKKLSSWSTELEKGVEWPKTELKLAPGPAGAAPAAAAPAKDAKPERKPIHLRLHVAPDRAGALEEQFRLFSKGGFTQLKTTADDLIKDDEYVDLVFKDVPTGALYSLEVSRRGQPSYLLFDGVAFEDLDGHDGSDGEEEEDEDEVLALEPEDAA